MSYIDELENAKKERIKYKYYTGMCKFIENYEKLEKIVKDNIKNISKNLEINLDFLTNEQIKQIDNYQLWDFNYFVPSWFTNLVYRKDEMWRTLKIDANRVVILNIIANYLDTAKEYYLSRVEQKRKEDNNE